MYTIIPCIKFRAYKALSLQSAKIKGNKAHGQAHGRPYYSAVLTVNLTVTHTAGTVLHAHNTVTATAGAVLCSVHISIFEI